MKRLLTAQAIALGIASTLATTSVSAIPTRIENVRFDQFYTDRPYTNYVQFESVENASYDPITVAAELKVPKGYEDEALPVVVVLHGSSGLDSRGEQYTAALNAAGFATLELDLWGARGWVAGEMDRPRAVHQTLPELYGALKYLSTLEQIDKDRIGVLGFSWGGVMSMLSATQEINQWLGEDIQIAAHAAHYPLCWGYNTVPGYDFYNLTGAPILIQEGTEDAYDTPTSCQTLIDSLPEESQSLITLKMYEGATHAWDRLQPVTTVYDPYACQGAGCEVPLVPDYNTTKKSTKEVIKFFRKSLAKDLQPSEAE
jgi:dienelactone hydrolase